MPFYKEIRLAVRPYKALAQMIESAQMDKIHIATEGPLGWAARRYCQRHNIPYTTCYHTQFPDYIAKRAARILPFLHTPTYNLGVKFVTAFHKGSSGVMVATNSLKKQLENWGFDMPLIHLSRGVDFNIFGAGASSLFPDLKRPIALYVGRISIEKNLEAFLDMEWDGTKVLVGNGPTRAELMKKYPDAHFVGSKKSSELAAHYHSSDIFVFPSKTDTFGIVLIESLACGLPVAAYDVMGPKDIIVHPDLGALSDNDDGLSYAAYRALEHGNRKKCVEHAKEFYNWRSAGQQFFNGL